MNLRRWRRRGARTASGVQALMILLRLLHIGSAISEATDGKSRSLTLWAKTLLKARRQACAARGVSRTTAAGGRGRTVGLATSAVPVTFSNYRLRNLPLAFIVAIGPTGKMNYVFPSVRRPAALELPLICRWRGHGHCQTSSYSPMCLMTPKIMHFSVEDDFRPSQADYRYHTSATRPVLFSQPQPPQIQQRRQQYHQGPHQNQLRDANDYNQHWRLQQQYLEQQQQLRSQQQQLQQQRLQHEAVAQQQLNFQQQKVQQLQSNAIDYRQRQQPKLLQLTPQDNGIQAYPWNQIPTPSPESPKKKFVVVVRRRRPMQQFPLPPRLRNLQNSSGRQFPPQGNKGSDHGLFLRPTQGTALQLFAPTTTTTEDVGASENDSSSISRRDKERLKAKKKAKKQKKKDKLKNGLLPKEYQAVARRVLRSIALSVSGIRVC